MEGLILAAGLGTRLKPLTDHKPKALVEVGGKTLLETAINKLASYGVEHCVVNIHCFADMVEEYLQSRTWPCQISISDERNMLLDTGGALKHAAHLFSGSSPVLIHNVDIISEVNLKELIECHHTNNNLATLCVSDRPSTRKLAFDDNGYFVGRYQDEQPGLSAYAFSGIHIVEPAIFPLLPADDHPYSIIDCYISLASNHKIGRFLHGSERWFDVGTPEKLKKALSFQN